MFHNLYIDRPTLVHSLDPRAKIICMLLLSLLPFVFNDPAYTGSILLLVLLLAAAGQCLPNIARFRYFFALIFCVNAILWQFYVRGSTVLLVAGPLHVTRQGLLYGVAVGIRFVTVLMMSLIFVSCTRTEDLTVGLAKLGLPQVAALVVAMTIRLIPTFVSAASMMMEAQVARGLNIATRNPVKRVRHAIPVTVPLLMYALRHASLMSLALEARGYSPQVRRTSYADLVMRPRDVVVLTGLTVGFGACLWLRVTGHGVVVPGRI